MVRSFLACLSMSRLPFRIIVHLALILERALSLAILCISPAFLQALCSILIIHFVLILEHVYLLFFLRYYLAIAIAP